MSELRVVNAAALRRSGGSPLRSAILGIAEREVDFARRRFALHRPTARQHLERAGRAFVTGYNTALASSVEELPPLLGEVDPDLAGFAHEGAAMALTLLDLFTFWRRRRWRVLLETAPQHSYLIQVGAGWALARLRIRRVPSFLRGDPLHWRLVVDGYGFHEGFFAPERTIRRAAEPRLEPGLRANFDQGVGRSLWFFCAADPDAIAEAIAGFPEHRRGDLWSGSGLACAYAGGVDETAVRALLERAGDLASHLFQGVVFAAKARQRAANPTAATETACRVVCGMTVDAAAALADETTCGLDLDDAGAYEEWRRRIRDMRR